MKWINTPIGKWFLALFFLNILDVIITVPAYEANPVTLYLWGQIGIFLSAWLKIGLVFLLGGLCQLTRRVATQTEWAFSRKLLRTILVLLVSFYTFVVAWNIVNFGSINF